METKQKIFGSFYVFCEFKEYPNSPKGFESLRVRNTRESPELRVFFNFELYFHPWFSVQYAEFPEIIVFVLYSETLGQN